MGKIKKEIKLKIIDIVKISYIDINPEKYDLQGTIVKDSKIDYGAKVNLNPIQDIVEIVTFANFYLIKNEEKLELFGIESKHTFHVLGFKEVFQTEQNNTYKIPDEVMLTMFNISISGMRGMLALLNTRPEYKNLHLPIIDSVNLLKGFKK